MRKSSIFILLFFAANLVTVITLASLARVESARYQEYVPQGNGVIVLHHDKAQNTQCPDRIQKKQYVIANPFKVQPLL